MNYAKVNSGAVTAAPKQKAKATAQKRRRVPPEFAAQERQRSRTCRPPAICPAGAAAYGFLKTRFLPHYTGQPIMGSEKEKGDFYRSLGLLCSHYGINPVDTTGYAYPYGREVALYNSARLLKDKHPQHIDMELQQDDGIFSLHATEYYYTGNTLFYIPVLPVHYMMQDKKHRKVARLLLCIFSYLYHTAGVPYYTEDSYLYWHYEMVSEWLTNDPDDWEQETYYNYMSQSRAALHYGETMRRRIKNTVHFDHFREWVDAFTPDDTFGRECLNLAQRFYALWQEYPQSSIYTHADESCLPDLEIEDFDDGECITMEKYIGFVASTDGWLYENVEQSVNGYFNESLSKQEPVLKRYFDGRAQDTDTLGFECRLFPLINELCYLLNNYDYDTKRATV